MDEIQAAFLSVKLRYIDQENSRRQEIASYYLENIRNSKEEQYQGEFLIDLFVNVLSETVKYLTVNQCSKDMKIVQLVRVSNKNI